MKSPPQKYIFPSMQKFHCSDLKLKLNKLSPKESQNIHLISKQILFKRKKKFENRTQESRPENSLINHHENCDRTISMPSRFPFSHSPVEGTTIDRFQKSRLFPSFPFPLHSPPFKRSPRGRRKNWAKEIQARDDRMNLD